MDEQTRRFTRQEDEDALRLDEVLEPYDEEYDAYDEAADMEPYDDPAYDEDEYLQDDYSDYHAALDEASRFKVAMGAFDLVSVLVGVVVILVLVGMLVSLLTWLRSDIQHSALLLQSGLQ